MIELGTPVKHKIKELDHNETEFTCSDCSKVFSSKSKLTSHMLNIHVVGEYSCQLCSEKFTLKNELKNHTLKAHAKKADDVSQFSSKTFKAPVDEPLKSVKLVKSVNMTITKMEVKAKLGA